MRRLVLGSLVALGLSTAAPRDAEAFCGFFVAPGDKPLYNDATMVALMREGTRTALTMSNNYKGPAADFAMVVPVPVVLQKENVRVLNKSVFTRLETLSAPRLVEYWEQDPCNPYPPPPPMSAPPSKPSAVMKSGGAGNDKDYGVKIEAKFEVGEYQILVLSAKQSDGLESWLHDNKYNIPKGASTALAPYIKEQMKFFVAKIDVKKVQMDAQGVAQLSPLRFHYESNDFRLPVRLGLLNAQGRQDLIIFTLSKQSRYEVANYPNVFIPTNLEVSDDTRKSFAPFYAALFDEAVNKGQGKGIVTEYAWTTPFFSYGGGMKCDPCPPEPLTDNNDLAALGGDVLLGMGAPPPPPLPPQPPPGPGAPKPMPMPPSKPMPSWGGGWGGGFNMVLTRLHARYDSTSLTDDLVFKTADAIVGGREHVVDDKGAIEKGAQPAPQNNFQARYIIRHAWTGAIKCKNPQRGVWGGPPGTWGAPPPPAPANGLASVPRGAIKLASFLKAGMPAFDVKMPGPLAIPPPAVPSSSATEDAGAPAPSAEVDASVPPVTSASAAPSVAPVEPNARGCGCSLPGGAGSAVGFGATGVALAIGLARRRRR